MTITASLTQDNGLSRTAAGAFLDDAASPAAYTVNLGFRPRRIIVWNQTDAIQREWLEGMTDAHAMKTVAVGTQTWDTSGGITVTDTGFTVAAAAILQNKQNRWFAWG